MATNRDLLNVCEQVLQAKAEGKSDLVINGVDFDDMKYDPNEGGRCEENTHDAFKAATGSDLSEFGCCAGGTYANFHANHPEKEVARGEWDESKLMPGDFLFFGGGSMHSCGHAVGHTGIWMGNGRMFQQTSRASLGITQQPPTQSQKDRFLGAFRLLPIDEADEEPTAPPDPSWAAADIAWVVENSLMGRGLDGDFRGDEPMTRAEAAVVLRRLVRFLRKEMK